MEEFDCMSNQVLELRLMIGSGYKQMGQSWSASRLRHTTTQKRIAAKFLETSDFMLFL